MGTRVLVDGVGGTIEVDPDEEDAAERVARDLAEREALASWTGPAATSDGVPVKLLANVADAASAQKAAEAPVEGVGLFRTELSFLNTADEPSVEEQAEVYAGVLDAVRGRALRRGPHARRRLGQADRLRHQGRARRTPRSGSAACGSPSTTPGLLDRQLDGIALAAKNTGTTPWVMAPMVATIAEAADFAAKVRERGIKPGIMVEIPSAAILAHQMLEVVDFLSIGTNDLTQYTMAADRMATDLTHLTDPWQPAVLHLIAITAEAGKRAGKPVGVCGEAAADPLLAPCLVGMGITSLSMASAAVRAVGSRLSPGQHGLLRGRRRGRTGRHRAAGRAGRRARGARGLSRPARARVRGSGPWVVAPPALHRRGPAEPAPPLSGSDRERGSGRRPRPATRARPCPRGAGPSRRAGPPPAPGVRRGARRRR